MAMNPALTHNQTKSSELADQETEFAAGEPVWEIAQLFPAQGQWSEDDYLELDTNHLIEYSYGYIEVLEMPTELHQDIVFILAQLLAQFVKVHDLGKVLFAPLRVRVGPKKYREPDIVFMFKAHSERRGEQYWNGADLVMEVLSPGNRNLDLVTKRREYARAGIPEYWLVDPEYRTIVVLFLEGQRYTIYGEFHMGEQAASRLLEGFSIDVSALFTQAE